MSQRVRYPRALAVFRVGLYLAATLAAVSLTGVAVAALVLVLGLGGVALLLNGDVNVLALAGLFGLVVVTLGLLVGGLATGVRRVDRAVRDAARVPTPVERLKQQYVDAEFDEAEFERRLAAVLDDEAVGDGTERTDTGGHGGAVADDVDGPIRVEVESA